MSERARAVRGAVARVICGLVMVGVVAGCATPLERRVAKYPGAWQSLSAEDQVLAQRGQLREGMTRDGVYFSWGPPHGVRQGVEGGTAVEEWRYSRYVAVPTYRTRFGFGSSYGYCPHGYGYYDFGPEYYYVPQEAGRVEFRDGRVTSYAREY